MKRRPVLGFIEVNGVRYPVKDKRAAQMIRDQANRIAALEKVIADGRRWQEGMREELRQSNERLAKLQNRVWVRIGEALKLVKP